MSAFHGHGAAITALVLTCMLSPISAAWATSAKAAPLISDASPGDPARGARVYQTRCSWCHAMDEKRMGPPHRGLFGRRAGGVAGYKYSPALQHSSIIWSDGTLDAWLQDPPALVPRTGMTVRLASPRDRADVIAYLRVATRGPKP